MRVLLLWTAIAVVCNGCVSDQGTVVTTSAWAERLKPKPPSADPSVVELHYIFLERELGSEQFKDVWQDADELVIPLDKRKELEANGLRVGKLGSRLSPELLKMLENSNPSGEGRRHVTGSGGLVHIQMTQASPTFQLFTLHDDKPRGEEIPDAHGAFRMVPSVTSGSAVRVEIAPMIEYGVKESKYETAPDLSGLKLRNKRPTKTFPELALDLEVESSEYILLGRAGNARRTLGDHFFTRRDGAKATESVLLIRVVRPSRDELFSAGYDHDEFFLTPVRRSRPTGVSNVRETVVAAGKDRNSAGARPKEEGL